MARRREHLRGGAAGLLLGLAACGEPESLSPVPAPDAGVIRCPELSDANPWGDQLGTHTLAERGALLGCAHVGTATHEGVSYNSDYPLIAAGEAKNGFELFVLQYVSEGRPGEARAVTALAYLPTGDESDLLTVAAGHGMYGIGPTCGPTHAPNLIEPLAIPLVGRGHAVLAPDYAGVGVDNGMTSYLVGVSEAAATLDGLRALRQLSDPRFDVARLSRDVVSAGWSQGGHGALFTHQLFDDTLGLRLLGSVAFAPGLGSAKAWSVYFNDAARPVGGLETFAVGALYAHMMHAGAPAPEAWLTPAAVEALPGILHDDCLPSLLGTIPAKFATLGDLYTASFLEGAAGCTFANGCSAFEPWASELAADEPGRFTSTAPVLILQGLADILVPPQTTACTVDRLKQHGTLVQACAYATADHVAVVAQGAPEMLRWIEGRRAGETPDVCGTAFAATCVAP